ncbi:hypothetical protein JCM10207_008689 [Rhodosporidiobolus poonsookiae]
MSDTEPRPPHVSDKTIARLEANHDPDLVEHLEPLTQLWGKPCFEMVQLPFPQLSDHPLKRLDGVESVPHARFTFDADPPRIAFLDYKELWDEMQVYRKAGIQGFCLWGQPGNGKSSALDIFSLICVEREIPFLRWTLGEDTGYLVLVVDGQPRVFSVPRGEIKRLEFKVDNFFFVDSGDRDATFGEMAKSSGKFLPRTTMVLATSPRPSRFSEWVKQRSALYATIKLVTREEALAVWILKDSPQQSSNFSDHSSAIKFDELTLKLGEDVPDEGYPEDVVEQDMADPLVEIVPGLKVYTPIFRYHAVGPDLRRIFLPVKPKLALDAPTFMDHIVDDLPIASVLREPNEIQRVVERHVSVAQPGELPGYHQIFYHAPMPSEAPDSRWTSNIECKTTIPSAFVAQRLVEETAKLELDQQRRLVERFAGTGAFHGLMFEPFVCSKIASASILAIKVVTAAEPLMIQDLTIDLGGGALHAGWRPANVDKAPSAIGVHPTLPRNFSAVDALIVGRAADAPVAIALQTTVAHSHDVKPAGVRTIKSRLMARDGGSMVRRPIYVFATPKGGAAQDLAVSHYGEVDGYDVGFVFIGSWLASSSLCLSSSSLADSDYPPYSKALEQEKDFAASAALLSNRSAAYLGLQEYDKALTDANLAVLRRPDWSKAYTRAAEVYARMQDFGAAEQSFVLLHGEGDQFNASLIGQAYDGGYRTAGELHRLVRKELGGKGGETVVFLVSDAFKPSAFGHSSVFQDFLRGFASSSAPCFVALPCEGEGGAVERVQQLLSLHLPLSSTSRIFLGALHTNYLSPYLEGLPDNLRSKTVLLETVTLAPKIRRLIEDRLYRSTTVVSHLFGEMGDLETDMGLLGLAEGERSSSASEQRALSQGLWDETPSNRAKVEPGLLPPPTPIPSGPFKPPVLRFNGKTAPCNMFYLQPEGCFKTNTRAFSHHYPFTDEEWRLYPLYIASTVCGEMKEKGECSRGSKCIKGHRCPFTIKSCPWDAQGTCHFSLAGLPHSVKQELTLPALVGWRLTDLHQQLRRYTLAPSERRLLAMRLFVPSAAPTGIPVLLLALLLALCLPRLAEAYIPAVPVNDTSALDSSEDLVHLAFTAGVYNAQVSRQLWQEDYDDDGNYTNVSSIVPWTRYNKGVLVHFNESLRTQPPASVPWIAMISCDTNGTSGSFSEQDDIFTICRDLGAQAALLYSLHSEGCQITQEYLTSFEKVLDVFATTSVAAARIIENQFGNIGSNAYAYDSASLNNSASVIQNLLDSNALSVNGNVPANVTSSDGGSEMLSSLTVSPTAFSVFDPATETAREGATTTMPSLFSQYVAPPDLERRQIAPPVSPISSDTASSTSAEGTLSGSATRTSVAPSATSGSTANYLGAVMAAANLTVGGLLTATPTSTSGSQDQNNNNSQSTAMLILCDVTFLFLVIIMSGAIRAIRHPERYGPRAVNGVNGDGAGGQTRAGGLTRAILDTFPVVRFGGGETQPRRDEEAIEGEPPKADGEIEGVELATLPPAVPAARRRSTDEELEEIFDDDDDEPTRRRSVSSVAGESFHSATSTPLDHRPSVASLAPIPASPPLEHPQPILAHAQGSSSSSSSPSPPLSPARALSPTTPTSPTGAAAGVGAGGAGAAAAEDEIDTCPICFTEFEAGDELRVLPCDQRHMFHTSCIDPWLLEVSSSCPLCRLDLAQTAADASSPSTGAPAGEAAEVEERREEERVIRHLRALLNRPSAAAWGAGGGAPLPSDYAAAGARGTRAAAPAPAAAPAAGEGGAGEEGEGGMRGRFARYVAQRRARVAQGVQGPRGRRRRNTGAGTADAEGVPA